MHIVYHRGQANSHLTKGEVEQAGRLAAMLEDRESPPPHRWPARYPALAIKALRRGEMAIGRFAEYLNISRHEAMMLRRLSSGKTLAQAADKAGMNKKTTRKYRQLGQLPRAGKLRTDPAKSGKVALSRGKRVSFFLATALLVVVSAEGLFAIASRFVDGEWPYSRSKNADYLLFEPHAEWVITPRKDVTLAVSGHRYSRHIIHHNTDGFRGQEFSRVKTKYRIACIGGSTTYCVGVSENQTWEFCLDQLFQPDCELLNFGIPGHSSVEHKKLLPQILTRYSPDLVIVQMGLNDLRNMNLADPGPDYENFHQRSLLFTAHGACWRERLPRFALLLGPVALLKRINVLSDGPFPHGEPAGHVSDSVDPRVVEIFSANLDILLRECRAKHVRVVLLPHALSPEVITDTNYKCSSECP